ncbi:uncharacterized protein B0H18DRAFT_660153 [Fomitopsis serialis]|uniref:uncharacterized protein n=1 Tax=Fomitopsis serialis TaxID=139415 RepID=UPI002008B372|nr:uncharacterized protein B0H18DRAFT_229618 [Neoantrodia serialis]XP_047889152.1 uncharacterized protein B0H18DRAFT_660153 [Neoantrodia serialis]KAH9912752.1 hypothetical protein B0H18DRAFT_229618 [Neoantrodia serialis]KAH9918828.1 hypothetical protein B0H18DRAFT_660153 [Neoantrodia serialis]
MPESTSLEQGDRTEASGMQPLGEFHRYYPPLSPPARPSEVRHSSTSAPAQTISTPKSESSPRRRDPPPHLSQPEPRRDVSFTSLSANPSCNTGNDSSNSAIPGGWAATLSQVPAWPPSRSNSSATRVRRRDHLFEPSPSVPPPVATSTPWRLTVGSSPPLSSAPLASSSEVRQAVKEAVDKTHLQDLLDGPEKFLPHIRRPDEAQALFNELNAPDATGKYKTLFEESASFTGDDLEASSIVESQGPEGRATRFRLSAEATLRQMVCSFSSIRVH